MRTSADYTMFTKMDGARLLSSKAGTSGTDTHHFSTPIIQGLNRFCFTGGIRKLSAWMPGPVSLNELWATEWLLGNLRRATVPASTDGLWPFNVAKDYCPAPKDHAVNQVGIQARSACRDTAGGFRGNPDMDYNRYVAVGVCPTLLEDVVGRLNYSQPMFASILKTVPGLPLSSAERATSIPNDDGVIGRVG